MDNKFELVFNERDDAAELKNHKDTADLLRAAGATSTLRSTPKPKKAY